MNNIFITTQIAISVFLAIAILLQGGGSGLGSSWGGGIGTATSFRSRRGVEKFLLYASAILAIAFFFTTLTGFLF
jgi:protein translocase SecG subunit